MSDFVPPLALEMAELLRNKHGHHVRFDTAPGKPFNHCRGIYRGFHRTTGFDRTTGGGIKMGTTIIYVENGGIRSYFMNDVDLEKLDLSKRGTIWELTIRDA